MKCLGWTLSATGAEKQRGLLQQEREEVEALPDNEMEEQYKDRDRKKEKECVQSGTIPFQLLVSSRGLAALLSTCLSPSIIKY